MSTAHWQADGGTNHTHGRRPSLAPLLQVSLLGLLLVAVQAAFQTEIYRVDAYRGAIAVACGGGVLGLMLFARSAFKLPWLSASLVYLALFWLFYYGLAFTAAVLPEVLLPFPDRAIDWMHWPNAHLAMLLGLLGATAFVLGVAVVGPSLARTAPVADGERMLFAVGWVVMLVGIGLAVLTVARGGGLGAFGLGYREFRATVLAPSPLSTFIQVSQLGCLMALCGAQLRRKQWRWPLGIWSAFGAVLLLLGLRNEVMIPMVTFAVVLARRGVRFQRRAIVAAAVVGLVGMPVLRAVRTVGVQNLSAVDWSTVTPLGTLVEMGGSLRAVNAYVDWIEKGDEPLRGIGYWAPFDRHLVVWLLPDRRRVPVVDDERVPAQQMSVREGAVGAAALGEAYYNFGAAGPFMFFGAVGLLFGWLDRRLPFTPYASAGCGAILFVFLWNIRGEWLHVPSSLGAYLLIIGACWVISRVRTPGPVS